MDLLDVSSAFWLFLVIVLVKLVDEFVVGWVGVVCGVGLLYDELIIRVLYVDCLFRGFFRTTVYVEGCKAQSHHNLHESGMGGREKKQTRRGNTDFQHNVFMFTEESTATVPREATPTIKKLFFIMLLLLLLQFI